MGNIYSSFNSKEYLTNYPDLIAAGIDTHEKALNHWINHGQAEGRTYFKFEWEQYLANYPDLRGSGINTPEKAVEHWFNHGIHEGRTCNPLNFNWEQYLLNYPQLVLAGVDTHEKALFHWNNHGIYEGKTDFNVNLKKVCIIYCYYERKNEQKNQTNLSFFIKYGLDKSRWKDMDITTLFVINGYDCEVLIPRQENIYVLKEENCSDWQGWGNGIKYMENIFGKQIYRQFSHLCLINCSAVGPIYEDSLDIHWLDPFLNKLEQENAVICSPCINFFDNYSPGGTGPRVVPIMSLIKLDKKIMDLLTTVPIKNVADTSINNDYPVQYNTILGKKQDKTDACLTGEYGLSRILLDNGYKISCLIYDNINYSDTTIWGNYSCRVDRHQNFTIDFFIKSIFIKNYWRMNNNLRDGLPICYNETMAFINKKLNTSNIFYGKVIDYDYHLLDINNQGECLDSIKWNNKMEFYFTSGYCEEFILWPAQKQNNEACVIYAHYDSDNIIKDYVIQSLKILIILGYDIVFCTSCNGKIKNVDLPFEITYYTNKGAGTDWYMWLDKLNVCYLYKRVLLVNDSLLLGINGIDKMKNSIEKMRSMDLDVWGHWDSTEINYHFVGTPIEIKNNVIIPLINFISETLPKCNNKMDYIHVLETQLIKHLKLHEFKMDVVIKEEYISENDIIRAVCPSHNPRYLERWINLDDAFAIKWKYVLPHLKGKNTSPEFNYLLRYLNTGDNIMDNIFPDIIN